MNNILTIVKKELARFFTDRKLVLSTLVLPGLMIYVMYSFMGSAFSSKSLEDYRYQVALINTPPSLVTLVEGDNIDDVSSANNDLSSYQVMLEEKKLDAVVVFDEQFESMVANESGTPNVAIYYNSTKEESSAIYRLLSEKLNQYENSISNVFDLNTDQTIRYDLASDKELTGKVFSSLLPMLLMIFIFSGCMGVAPDSIAGEKERGTIATLLITPIKRSQIAIGKIISLSILSVLTGLSSFIGTMLSMPKLLGGETQGIDVGAYTMVDYGFLLIVIVSTVLVIIALLSVISSYAKSVKEAGTYMMPFMLLVMFIGISSMMLPSTPNILTAFIPLYNNVSAMSQILQFNLDTTYLIITLVVNIVVAIGLVFTLTKIFNNEKIMFNS